MNILYVTQLFYPATFGGGEYIFFEWAKHMAKKDHNVSVITQRLKNSPDFEQVDNIQIHRVGSTLELAGTLPVGFVENISFLVGSFFKISSITKKQKIDLIHSNTYLPVFSSQLNSRLHNIPHIVTVHDVYFQSDEKFWSKWSEQSKISKTSSRLGPFVEKLVLKINCSMFHTVSEKSKQDMIESGVTKKIHVIPNGIDLEKYQSDESTKSQAIFVGRLVFYKNIETIIIAFEKIVKKIPTAKLLIVGDGPSRKFLESKANRLGMSDNIVFTGTVSEDEKIKLISQSNVLLNPSLVEGFGIVVLESFACKRPAIVSDCEPLSDLVEDSVDGFVVPAKDPAAWAEKIIELFDSKKAQDFGKNGYEKVKSRYTISSVTRQLEELYKKLV